MLQELWRATSVLHFFTYSICHHLSLPIAPCPKAWRADEAQKAILDCTAWPAAGGGRHHPSPSAEQRAALFLAVSHPLGNHFHGRGRPEAEALRITCNSGNSPAKKNKKWAKGCCAHWGARGLGCFASCFPLTYADTWWHFLKQQQLDLCYHMKILLLLFPLWTSAGTEHVNKSQQQPQLAWAYFNLEMLELGNLMWFHWPIFLKNLLKMLADIHIRA